MCSEILRIISFVAVTISILQKPVHAAVYSVESLKGNELHLSVELQPYCCRSTQPVVFAFSSLPGTSFNASIHYDNGSSEALASAAAGWAGREYLQWCSFTPEQAACIDRSQHARIVISFDRALYRGIKKSSVTCRNCWHSYTVNPRVRREWASSISEPTSKVKPLRKPSQAVVYAVFPS